MFIVCAISTVLITGYPIILNCIILGLLSIIWKTDDKINMFIKAYLMFLAFLHFTIYVQ